jgi:hypothetical protein
MYSLFTLKDSTIITLSIVTLYLLTTHLREMFYYNEEIEMEMEMVEHVPEEEEDEDRFKTLLDDLN